MSQVFVSYSRADSDVVLPACDALRRAGFDVWLDQRSIPVSVPWLEEIEAAIRGSALMLVVDSGHWQASENCQAELALARKWLVPQLHVDAASLLLTDVSVEVAAALAKRTSDDKARTELFVRAGEWAGRDRPRGSLVSGRTLRRYSRAAFRDRAQLPTEVAAFIGASRRRQRRQTTLRRVGVLSAVALVLSGIAVYQALGITNSGIDQAIASLDEGTAYDVFYEKSPYLQLEYLAKTADNDGWLVDYQFARAFSEPLPDAAVPSSDPVVSARIPAELFGARSATSPDGVLRAELATGPTVLIRRVDNDAVERVLTARGSPSTMTWSPDGDWLAVGVDSDVELLDTLHGTGSRTLRGSKGDVLAIAFDGDKLNAVTDTQLAVSWPNPLPRNVLRGAGWIMDAVPVHGAGTVLVLDRSGALSVIDPNRLAEENAPRIDTMVGEDVAAVAVAVDSAGERAAVVGIGDDGRTELAIVSLLDSQVQTHDIDDCRPYGLTFDKSGTSIALACGLEGMRAVDPATGRQLAVPQKSSVVGVAQVGPYFAAGTEFGQIELLDNALRRVDIGTTKCAQNIRPLRPTADGRYLFHGGNSLGALGCALRVDVAGETTAWDHFVFPGQQAHESRAVAVSPNDELVAFGFSDGTVRVYGTELMQPTAILRPFAGEVRGLAFAADGASLLIATRDGDIAVEPVVAEVEALGAKRARAQAAVDRAVSLHLYSRQ